MIISMQQSAKRKKQPLVEAPFSKLTSAEICLGKSQLFSLGALCLTGSSRDYCLNAHQQQLTYMLENFILLRTETRNTQHSNAVAHRNKFSFLFFLYRVNLQANKKFKFLKDFKYNIKKN
jgi:hypothetical protein